MNEREAGKSLVQLAKDFAGGADCISEVNESFENRVSVVLTCEGSMTHADLVVTRLSREAFTIEGPVRIGNGEGQSITAQMTTNARYLGPCPD